MGPIIPAMSQVPAARRLPVIACRPLPVGHGQSIIILSPAHCPLPSYDLNNER